MSEKPYKITDDLPFNEAGLLKLNCDKALFHLNWDATLDYEETIKMTADWYSEFYNNTSDMLEFTNKQIDQYQDIALDRGSDKPKITKIKLSKMLKLEQAEGSVMHGIKASDSSYNGFGEAYFSTVNQNSVKGWKLHKKMTLNLLVPHGEIRIIVHNAEDNKDIITPLIDVVLGKNNYSRITIPPETQLHLKA